MARVLEPVCCAVFVIQRLPGGNGLPEAVKKQASKAKNLLCQQFSREQKQNCKRIPTQTINFTIDKWIEWQWFCPRRDLTLVADLRRYSGLSGLVNNNQGEEENYIFLSPLPGVSPTQVPASPPGLTPRSWHTGWSQLPSLLSGRKFCELSEYPSLNQQTSSLPGGVAQGSPFRQVLWIFLWARPLLSCFYWF